MNRQNVVARGDENSQAATQAVNSRHAHDRLTTQNVPEAFDFYTAELTSCLQSPDLAFIKTFTDLAMYGLPLAENAGIDTDIATVPVMLGRAKKRIRVRTHESGVGTVFGWAHRVRPYL